MHLPDAEQLPRCDVLVVGGGINGCGIARDLAGRGLGVWLCEQHDLAAHTSSASSKLVHGGLRYLEQFEFGLVRKALHEREVLLRAAPHLVRPLRIVMPHDPALRPRWMLRAGLFLYDHLARRGWLPASSAIDLRTDRSGAVLRDAWRHGFAYADARADDARLVVACALDAAQRGCRVHTRTRVGALARDAQGWTAELIGDGGARTQLRARAVVNAGGPWADAVHAATGLGATRRLRLVKGSHIVVPRLQQGDDGYILQQPDRRIVFVLPFGARLSLIGTTDVEYRADPALARIDSAEVDYLCASVARYFRRAPQASDIVWSYAGVRPLLDEPDTRAAEVSRDYRLELDVAGAPLLSVWGGKLTTFRLLAEQAADLLAPRLGCRAPAWTGGAVLPGGDLAGALGRARPGPDDFDAFAAQLQQRHAWLDAAVCARWAHGYGTRAERLLDGVRGTSGLGAQLAPGLYEAELDYLAREEWARCADDVLWRRSKLGLEFDLAQRSAVELWFERARPDHAQCACR